MSPLPMVRVGVVGVLALVAACSKSSAPPADVAASATVKTVDCTASPPSMTVTTSGLAYSPASITIPVNSVVQWTMPSEHNVSSTTPGFAVDFGKTACLQFTAAGEFDYLCSVHLFTGKVIVQ